MQSTRSSMIIITLGQECWWVFYQLLNCLFSPATFTLLDLESIARVMQEYLFVYMSLVATIEVKQNFKDKLHGDRHRLNTHIQAF